MICFAALGGLVVTVGFFLGAWWQRWHGEAVTWKSNLFWENPMRYPAGGPARD